MNLSTEQNLIFEKYKKGENIFITGVGGTGKTKLIQYITNHAKFLEKKIQVCAMTGCAAVLLQCNANTIHSWAGLGLARGSKEEVVNRVIKSKIRRKKWNSGEVIIIGGINKVSGKLINFLNNIWKKNKKKFKTFWRNSNYISWRFPSITSYW